MNDTKDIYTALGISQKAVEIVEKTESGLMEQFHTISALQLANQAKVLSAFRDNRVEARHFAGSTGYGYGDLGRDMLDQLFADIFHTEAAIVRPQITSGTHALSLCLYALAKRGGQIVSVTGKPYDTLLETIGIVKNENSIDSLADLGVSFSTLELTREGSIDFDHLEEFFSAHQPDITYIQRSRGYDWRPSISITEMERAIRLIKSRRPDTMVIVDNCYGEFTEAMEPTDVGADLIIGSLIKNPGGGLAPTGAYIAGCKKLIERIQYRLTAPGIGMEVGSWAAGYLPFYQGLFLAPHVVGECLKGAVLISAVYQSLGFDVMPRYDDPRSDITQSIRFLSEEQLLQFCRSVQSASPVDSHVVPEPWPMPGYQNNVIMAAGTFIQGASIELSADAPIKPPYIGYLQGGLTYEHCKLALLIMISQHK